MKKVLIMLLVVLFFVSGCGTASDTVEIADIKGYWIQVEEDWSGDVTDLTNNPYAYFEVTDKNLAFYTISFDEDEGYGVSEKYYKLEGNKIYYDYYELKGTDWKENMDEAYGGIFEVSFDGKKLVLTEYSNGIDESDGYSKDTYTKISAKDWPIEE